MLKSMTAFARTESGYDFGSLTWELRSVNHRYLDVNLRLPEELRGIEQGVREAIAGRIKRGKVDANLRYKPDLSGGEPVQIDKDYTRTLAQACREVAELFDDCAPPAPLDVLRWPGVITETERDVSPVETAAREQLEQTLQQMLATREREGERIRELLEQRCAGIEAAVQTVRDRRPEVMEQIRNRVQEKLNELQVQVDQDRLEQEMVYQAQRMDVDEELDRLDGHIAELRDILSKNEPAGRRLDFLIQEFNREANTLSSKANDAQTTKAAVDMKVMIEQMREQVQNVE